jgi:hypothetical protein
MRRGGAADIGDGVPRTARRCERSRTAVATASQNRTIKAAIESQIGRLWTGGWEGRCGGAVDRGLIMTMLDGAAVALKVLLFIWAAQLIWLGWHLLEHQLVKWGFMRSGSEDTSTESVHALRSGF